MHKELFSGDDEWNSDSSKLFKQPNKSKSDQSLSFEDQDSNSSNKNSTRDHDKESCWSLQWNLISNENALLMPNQNELLTVSSQEVKLNYKGNKNKKTKGVYSERADVIKKTLIRSIRRYLYNLFTKDFDIKSITDNKKSSQVRNKYQKEG